ncbi:iduronate 2-sulfatase-like isoform X2 [Stegodyphus dumicola]|uniref:iduronate 2-sulfatase-like isoform X2 n=1 Tax=Stegodyphus dumicola TaxID=202533 RepID=UPI0015B0B080|nr:iduronate 2-sulfatase-like isoform X2 [Stegodyphus dumicola]
MNFLDHVWLSYKYNSDCVHQHVKGGMKLVFVLFEKAFIHEFTGMQNVLFIVVDDLRPALGCYGDERAITPNIDQLASRSVIFKNAYAQQALCAPSRTSFLTSRRPDSLHLYDTGSYWRDSVGNFTTIPQHFKFHDYETISIGKVFHHGIVSNMTDDYPYSWTEYPYRPPTQKFKMRPVCPSSDGKNHMNLICPVDVAKQPGGSLPDIESTQYAINYLKSKRKGLNKDKPFFMGIGYYKPHIPFKFPREYLDLYPIDSMDLAPNNTLPPKLPEIAWNPWTDIRLREDVENLNVSFPYGPLPEDFQKLARQGYYASLSYMDDQLGKLLKALEDTGYAEHTVIILIGDHGWSLGEHQEWSKYSNFEVSVKVPLVLHIPGITDSKERKAFKHISVLDYVSNENKTMSVSNMNISASTYVPKYVTNKLVELVDLFPTLADIVNIPIPPLCRFYKTVLCSEGLTFYPLIKHIVKGSASEEFPWKTAAFSQYPRPSISPRNDSDQPDLEDIKYMGYSIRTARFRYTEWVSFDSKRLKPNRTQVVARELYDHKEDPFEANDVSDKPMYENIKKELSRKIKKGWRHAMPPGLFDSPVKKKEYLS